jgi:hypothetical protein
VSAIGVVAVTVGSAVSVTSIRSLSPVVRLSVVKNKKPRHPVPVGRSLGEGKVKLTVAILGLPG